MEFRSLSSSHRPSMVLYVAPGDSCVKLQTDVSMKEVPEEEEQEESSQSTSSSSASSLRPAYRPATSRSSVQITRPLTAVSTRISRRRTATSERSQCSQVPTLRLPTLQSNTLLTRPSTSASTTQRNYFFSSPPPSRPTSSHGLLRTLTNITTSCATSVHTNSPSRSAAAMGWRSNFLRRVFPKLHRRYQASRRSLDVPSIDEVAASLSGLRARIYTLRLNILKLWKRSNGTYAASHPFSPGKIIQNQVGVRHVSKLADEAIDIRENMEMVEEELRLTVEKCDVELQEMAWDGATEWELMMSPRYRVVRWEGPQLAKVAREMQQELSGCQEMLGMLRRRTSLDEGR